MARRGRRGRDAIDGILLLSKPAGITSNGALQAAKRRLNAAKAGHTGSLDPFATGLLPLCFGEATKVSAFLLDADKTYRAVMRLGSRTDTADATGKVIEERAVPELSVDQWRQVLIGFLGESQQVPPMYSALKRDGQRLYELARRGETVEREARRIEVKSIDLQEASGRRVVFRVCCTKGTYVRTLVEDIAEVAGTCAYTQSLHRERVGVLTEADAVGLAFVETAPKEKVLDALLPADRGLEALPRVVVDAGERFIAGQAVTSDAVGFEGLGRVYGTDGDFLGVGVADGAGHIAPKRVFKTA